MPTVTTPKVALTMSSNVKETTTETNNILSFPKGKRKYNMYNRYQAQLNTLLKKYSIQRKETKRGGAKRNALNDKTFNYLVRSMVTDHTPKYAQDTLKILSLSDIQKEGYGLKYDIVSGVYEAVKHSKGKGDKLFLATKLYSLPMSNNFSDKFAAYLMK